MLKRIILSLFVAFSPLYLMAQAMTDNQVINFIQKETSKGTSQAQIIQKLIRQGVTTAQLQRIRKKYNQQQEELQQSLTPEEKRDADRIAEPQQQNLGTGRLNDSRQLQRNMGEELSLFKGDSLYLVDETKKEIFGHNIFNNELLTFQPSTNMPTPANYRLGAGDNVVIEVWGASQQTINGVVSGDGTITIEGVGPIRVAGMTVTQANEALKKRMGTYYKDSNIQLTVYDARTVQVQVLGEVNTPGTYTVSSLSTAFNALYSAGGISDVGSLRDIKVYRAGKVIASIDVYDFIFHGNAAGDVHLQDNDVVVVGPYSCLVVIDGGVKRPMYYEMLPSESVGTLIEYAGGFTGDAYKKSVSLTRKSGAQNSIHTVDEFQFNNFLVDDADSVYVGVILTSDYTNLLEIKGAVERPGTYQLGDNISSLKDLINAAGGLKRDAFTNRVIIHRRKADRTLEVLNVNIGDVMNGTAPDVILQKDDAVFIPNNTDMKGEQTLSIYGEVREPGDYSYADNTTIEDLVLMAGGLTEAASTAKVNVYRRVVDSDALEETDNLTENFTFSIKDGFVIDGTQGFILQPFDQVMIRKSPVYNTQENVTINGYVNFPGRYAMSSKHYRLSDLIRDAGGVSRYGYSKGARLRRSLNDEERMIREQTIRAQQIDILEAATNADKDFNKELVDSLLSMKINQGSTYLVAVNLEEALKNPGGPEDIELRENDVIYVPQFSNTVKVSGAVGYSVSMQYKEGEPLSYYIKHAGGYDDRAKKKGVYSIALNGQVTQLKSSSKKGIEPGCEIVVPTKTVERKGMSTAEILSIGSSAASIAAVIATIANILKK
ncbi:MAG: SLBB domain-containing protein [Bacteroidaceae bacterium]|nr:SLBB domain-containing protein [Bacteroidaceae bacterium]